MKRCSWASIMGLGSTPPQVYFGLFGEHIGEKSISEIEGKDRASLFYNYKHSIDDFMSCLEV